jgi:hypothetical protein
MKCPVCDNKMIFLLQGETNYRNGSSIHGFSCICGVKWTAWNLTITGLKKVYEDAHKNRAIMLKNRFEEFKKENKGK